ncbi:uncharacterized protein KY384_008005 [Bacidia gigantensis]|uniref:uncharacterized protein n=1 Tax=Bacidia gigantensis TaxID=2732470 RepID=UPI001D04D7BF|nr:uncharacterized protein KY384_008005 [Bacidia gigantensis]KAG8527261.1 hypothetical protein KY384_008005 [Bacidia gigantensis]
MPRSSSSAHAASVAEYPAGTDGLKESSRKRARCDSPSSPLPHHESQNLILPDLTSIGHSPNRTPDPLLPSDSEHSVASSDSSSSWGEVIVPQTIEEFFGQSKHSSAAETTASSKEHSHDESANEQASEREDSQGETSHGPPFYVDPSTMTTLQVREAVKRSDYNINDYDAARRIGAGVVTKANGIVDKRRISDFSPLASKVKETVEENSNVNEKTFIVELHYALLSKTPERKDQDLTEEELMDAHNWIEAEWKKDFLKALWDIDYLSEAKPKITTGNEWWDKIIATFPRVKDSRPDISWGYHAGAFTKTQKDTLNALGCRFTTPEVYLQFLAWEAKCLNAPIEDAENQALGGGSTKVNARRRLGKAADRVRTAKAIAAKKNVPPVEYPRADPVSTHSAQWLLRQANNSHDWQDSIAFSLAVATQSCNLFVHWCEEVNPVYEKWHMTFLRDYSFHQTDRIALLHHNLDNIMDWGVGARKRKILEDLDLILDNEPPISDIVLSPAKKQPPAKKQKTHDDRVEGGDGAAALV